MGWTDKLKNKKDETKGAAKEQLGKATDDEQMEREGQIDQTKSNLKRLFRLKRATCFSRLRPAGIGGYMTTVSVVVG